MPFTPVTSALTETCYLMFLLVTISFVESIQRCNGVKNLGTAFFFSSLKNRDHYDYFFPFHRIPTLYHVTNYRNWVDKEVSGDKMLVWQFKQLVAERLQELEKCGAGIGKKLIVIDGLDECADANAQSEIIEIIATSVRELATPLCWAFFSRPESRIQATFSKANIAPLLFALLLISRDVDRDILKGWVPEYPPTSASMPA